MRTRIEMKKNVCLLIECYFPWGADSPFRSHFGTGRIQFCFSWFSVTFSISLVCNSTFLRKAGVVSPLNRLSSTRRSSPLICDWKRQGSPTRRQRLQSGALRSQIMFLSWHCRHGGVRSERQGFLEDFAAFMMVDAGIDMTDVQLHMHMI